MTNQPISKSKKIWNYFFNALLILVVLILIIPSWRISFQGWYSGLFMSEVEFETTVLSPIPEAEQNWALFNLESELINFHDLKGQPILLSFWATWCAPCRAELPELKEIKTEFNNQLSVIAVTEETLEVIENSGLHNDYNFLYFTPGIPDFFEITSYPTLILIDSEMNIVFRNEGAGKLNTQKNRQFLESLIRNK